MKGNSARREWLKERDNANKSVFGAERRVWKFVVPVIFSVFVFATSCLVRNARIFFRFVWIFFFFKISRSDEFEPIYFRTSHITHWPWKWVFSVPVCRPDNKNNICVKTHSYLNSIFNAVASDSFSVWRETLSQPTNNSELNANVPRRSSHTQSLSIAHKTPDAWIYSDKPYGIDWASVWRHCDTIVFLVRMSQHVAVNDDAYNIDSCSETFPADWLRWDFLADPMESALWSSWRLTVYFMAVIEYRWRRCLSDERFEVPFVADAIIMILFTDALLRKIIWRKLGMKCMTD